MQFLTDTAYSSLLDNHPSPKRSSKGKQRLDGLFLERLDSFIEAQLKEIEVFASREQRTLDEIRRLVAIPHAKFLFSQNGAPPPPSDPNNLPQTDSDLPTVRGILANLSTVLQMLHSTVGLESLLLAVSPLSSTLSAYRNARSETPDSAPSEASWIGGTELGKEFWMGLKGGGPNGAKAFRMKCHMHHEAERHAEELDHSDSRNRQTVMQPSVSSADSSANPSGSGRGNAKSGDIKTELNALVRQALRSASGNPAAEMRWTKPAALEYGYNVRLVGWPPTVTIRNPSYNTVMDNMLLLDLVRSGRMRFVKRGSSEWDLASSPVHIPSTDSTHHPVSTLRIGDVQDNSFPQFSESMPTQVSNVQDSRHPPPAHPAGGTSAQSSNNEKLTGSGVNISETHGKRKRGRGDNGKTYGTESGEGGT